MLALKEVIGVDIGPSHQQLVAGFDLKANIAGNFCPAYLFFKEAKGHAHKFGDSKYGCLGQRTCW